MMVMLSPLSSLLVLATTALLLSKSALAFAFTKTTTTTTSRTNHHHRQRSNNDYNNGVLLMGAVDGEIMPLPKGSLVALATPMKSDGALDAAVLRELLRWHKAEGTDGVVILGTTGEASTLSAEEKDEVMSIAREEVGGVLPIVVGTGGIDTKATIAATRQAKAMGADAALVVTPYYVKPSQAGLVEHFTAIADAVPGLPLVLYNVPGRTGVDLSVESTVKLSQHPMIQGLKDATGDNNRVEPMRKIIGGDFRLYSGEDGMAREFVARGGDGVISVTANVAPGAVSKIMALASSEDGAARAKAMDEPLSALHRDLFCEANPIPVKWALYKMGRTEDGIRLPLTVLGDGFHDRVEAALSKGMCIERSPSDSPETVNKNCVLSYSWPSRNLLLQGQLFDSGLINQALEIIEKRGGDFEITSFSVQPNDQFSNADFNFKRPSSIALKVFAVDTNALNDITKRLETLVEVMESAEGILTVTESDDGDEK